MHLLSPFTPMCDSNFASGTGWHSDRKLAILCTIGWGHPYSSITDYGDWYRLKNKNYRDNCGGH